MQTFQTLLLREWMQHGRRWWLIALIPLVISLLALQFGQVQLGEDDHVVATLLLTSCVYAAVMASVGWGVAYIQSGGMARRDWQDRSIEFWRSLPVPDASAVGATVLMHLVLLPLLVMALAVPSGLVVGLMVVARGFGWSALAGVPWHEVAAVVGVGALRLLLGSLLISFWVAPVALLTMAAAAWLKRWGVPLLWILWGLGGTILAKVYGLPQVLDTVQTFAQRAGSALLPLRGRQDVLSALVQPQPDLSGLPALLGQDALQRLQELASGWAAVAVLLSALGFALLVWRRRRG